MKRVFLFVATNLAIMLVLSIVVSRAGRRPLPDANGLNYGRC